METRMAVILLLAFLIVPIVEIGVFIEVGGALGLGPTLVIVVLTALAGTALLRAQGLATWKRAREAIERGEPPVNEVFDGVFLLVAGAFLLTPGFVTDTAGLLLFVPTLRRALRGVILRAMLRAGTVEMHASRYGPHDGSHDGSDGPHGAAPTVERRTVILEGAYREVSDAPPAEEKPEGAGKTGDEKEEERDKPRD
jgi:UPF0716 protein FxsA